ncbi:MAG TPA: lysophospholipase [Syntrophomonadaceae bacterium]|nr:alpha/beta hydrolase [Syntrophomonadaceae bacterium]HOQ09440.1 lysophospholipase [Syntrophomonadaceae bacterium]HPU48290.1 lysophospholipase [Syntrophomonadaceae bacterium]
MIIVPAYQNIQDKFNSSDGLELFCQKWIADQVKGVVVIAHGLGEHSNRYQNLLDQMAGKGISFYALDHRGHGRSQGKRGHILSFKEYVDDLDILVQTARRENPGIPLILLGHSMGGVIAFQYALKHSQAIDGLILSSAGLMPILAVPRWQQKLVGVLAKICPGLSIPNGLDAAGLSHDQRVVDEYLNDPLVHDKVSMRWFTEFISAGQDALGRAGELTMPLLIIHGKDDPICDYRASKQTMERASSADKTLYIFDGLLHETMNETADRRREVLAKVEQWILSHV